MRPARVLRPVLRTRLALALLAGGITLAPGPPVAAAAGCASIAGQQRVAAAAQVARDRYALERDGLAARTALRQIAADRALTDALRAGRLAAARAEAVREVVRGHHHITAIRVVSGNRVLVETDAYPFDVAGAQAPLRDRHGVVLGTLHVTIQDVIGFIRLVHKFAAAEVVVRGAQGEAKSSLPVLRTARLPDSGCATAAGRTYAVRSFGEVSFTGEPLRIWILK